MSIVGNAVGCYSPIGKTFIIEDENGNEITGVVTEQEVIFTAGDNDVREGMVYAGDSGVSEGTKNIPAYRTERGFCVVFSGENFTIPYMFEYDQYDYTELQCIITEFNSDETNSVISDKIVLSDNVYATNSNNILSKVSKDVKTKSINLNLVNNTDKDYSIHYFTYRKEE